MPSIGITGSNGISISRCLRNHHTVFHNGWINFHSHQQCKSVPIFSTSSPASVVSWFFNECHSNWSQMVSQYGFDFHFSHEQWWWAFLCMFIGCINVFFWKVSVRVLHPLFDGVVFFSCKSVLFLCRFWILAFCQMGILQNFFAILLVASSL